MAKTANASIVRRPLGEQVAERLLEVIRSDGLESGDVLPPITELAVRLGVSRTVVREAVDRLLDRGVIRRSRGRQWVLKTGVGARGPADQGEGLQHRSLADQAADAVLDVILSDGLREGDPLPPSTELARRYGVSIVVIREALASLAARGILRRRQGRESIVAAPGHDILSSIMRVRAHLDEIDIDEFRECRAGLETKAAQLAAQAGDPKAKRDALELHLRAMRRSKSNDEFREHDLAFHLTVARLSGNRAINLILEALNDLTRQEIAVTYQRVRRRGGVRGIETAVRNHERVARAVINGNPDEAGRAMASHFAFVRAR